MGLIICNPILDTQLSKQHVSMVASHSGASYHSQVSWSIRSTPLLQFPGEKRFPFLPRPNMKENPRATLRARPTTRATRCHRSNRWSRCRSGGLGGRTARLPLRCRLSPCTAKPPEPRRSTELPTSAPHYSPAPAAAPLHKAKPRGTDRGEPRRPGET